MHAWWPWSKRRGLCHKPAVAVEVTCFCFWFGRLAPHLFPLFPQVLYTLDELIVVILKRGSLLSHTRFGPAECDDDNDIDDDDDKKYTKNEKRKSKNEKRKTKNEKTTRSR